MSNLPNSDITIESVFKLLRTTSEEINSLNKGYNKGELNTGFFHMIGYDPVNKRYLVAKPTENANKFIVTEDYFFEHCTCLLSFNLFNN